MAEQLLDWLAVLLFDHQREQHFFTSLWPSLRQACSTLQWTFVCVPPLWVLVPEATEANKTMGGVRVRGVVRSQTWKVVD